MSEIENGFPQQVEDQENETVTNNEASNPTNTNISFSNIWVWVVLGLAATVTTVSAAAWNQSEKNIKDKDKIIEDNKSTITKKDNKIDSLYVAVTNCDDRAIEKMRKNLEGMRSMRLSFEDENKKADEDIKSFQKNISKINKATQQIQK